MIHFSQLHFSFFLIASEIKHKPALAYAMQFIQSFTPNRMFLSLPLVTWLGGTTQFAPFFIDSSASQSHAAKLTGKTYLGSFHWPGIFLCSFFIMYSQVFLGFRYHSCTHSFTHQTHTELLFHLSHSVCSGESKDEREISIFKEFKVEIQTSQLTMTKLCNEC